MLLASTIVRNVKAVMQAGHFDVVVAQRELLNRIHPLFEHLVTRSNRRFVFDFDDLVFTRPRGNGGLAYRVASVAFAENPVGDIVRMSSSVIAGSNYLKAQALKYNSNATLIPTVVDTDIWVPRRPGRGASIPTIAWTGNPSSSHYLEGVADVLARLSKRHRFRLLIIGASEATVSAFRDVPNVESRQWGLDTELHDLQEANIGIMPVADDAWAKGKCGLKAIQYMALGLPAVCSPYGANADIITHARDGFLAVTESDWLATLGALLADPQHRAQIGVAARATVIERYSLVANAPLLLNVLVNA